MFQIQFIYDLETDVILTLIQHMFQVQFIYDLETDVILTLLQYMFKYNHDMDPSTKISSRHRVQKRPDAKSPLHTTP